MRAAAWAVGVSLWAATSWADPPRVVDVAVVAPTGAAAFETSVRSVVERLPVVLTVHTDTGLDLDALMDAPAGDALARVGLVVTAGRARLVLRTGDRALVRDVPLPQGFDEVARESIAHLLRDALDVLLAGGAIGVARPVAVVAPVSAPVIAPALAWPPRPLPVATAWRFTMGAHYGAQWFGDDRVTHGPMVSLAFTAPLAHRARWGVEATGQYRVPVVIDGDPIGVRLDQGAVRAFARVEGDVGARVTLVARVGTGVDVVTPTARLTQSERAALDAVSTRVEPVVALGGGVRARLFDRVSLALDVGAELALSPARYTVTGLAGDVFAPWSVRPTASLGVLVAAGP